MGLSKDYKLSLDSGNLKVMELPRNRTRFIQKTKIPKVIALKAKNEDMFSVFIKVDDNLGTDMEQIGGGNLFKMMRIKLSEYLSKMVTQDKEFFTIDGVRDRNIKIKDYELIRSQIYMGSFYL